MRFTGLIKDSRIICSRLWRDGTIILIGATTENPYFEVNGALLSRSSVFELCPLSQDEVETLILRAVQDEKKEWEAIMR